MLGHFSLYDHPLLLQRLLVEAPEKNRLTHAPQSGDDHGLIATALTHSLEQDVEVRNEIIASKHCRRLLPSVGRVGIPYRVHG